MTSMCRVESASPRRKAFLAASLGAFVLVGTSAGALAQNSGCGDVQKLLMDRKSISDKLSASSKGKQIDAKVACTGFGQLVSNGASLIKWVDANKEWCSIPDSFAESIKADHGRAVQIRGKACQVAAKQVQMEKQAREGGGQGGAGGLLGGPGLTGASRLPQGAL